MICFLLLLILMSLFNQDLLCSVLFRLTLLILVVFKYFLVISLNFHFTIVCFQLPSYFFNFYVRKSLVRICLALTVNICSVTGKTSISSHIFFILCLYFLFVGSLLIQHSITILFTAFFHFILPFVWSVVWWQPSEAGSGTSCMLNGAPSQLVVPVQLTPLFLIHWFDISLCLRLCFMVSIIIITFILI